VAEGFQSLDQVARQAMGLELVTALKIAERCSSRAAPQQDVACWFSLFAGGPKGRERLIGDLIPRVAAAARARGWGVWGAGVALGLMLALPCAYFHRRSGTIDPFHGVIPAGLEPVDRPRATWAQYPP